jgi:predicted small secreted protein
MLIIVSLFLLVLAARMDRKKLVRMVLIASVAFLAACAPTVSAVLEDIQNAKIVYKYGSVRFLRIVDHEAKVVCYAWSDSYSGVDCLPLGDTNLDH